MNDYFCAIKPVTVPRRIAVIVQPPDAGGFRGAVLQHAGRVERRHVVDIDEWPLASAVANG